MTEDYTQESAGREEKRGHRRFRRAALFAAILLAVLGIVVVAAYRDGTGFDALRRFFSYGRAEKKSGEVSYSYDAAAENRFAVLGDSLVVLSGRELQVLDGEGKQTFSAAVSMSSPAIAQGGGRIAAYDVGGTELYVLDKNGQRLHLTADEDEPYIAATLNSSGWLAVTSEKKNYKGCVSVYNDKLELEFAFNSAQRFVMDAVVTENCKSLAAVTLGQKDSVFLSDIVLYGLHQTKPSADYEVSDGLVLSIANLDGKLAAVSDTCLTFASETGKVAGSYDYAGRYLREQTLEGDGFAALLLNRYRSGSIGTLVTVNPDGTERARLDIDSEVRDVSAAGRYLAVLYTDRLVIYTPELKEYASLTGTDYAKKVLMRADGSALLISSDVAKLYLP